MVGTMLCECSSSVHEVNPSPVQNPQHWAASRCTLVHLAALVQTFRVSLQK